MMDWKEFVGLRADEIANPLVVVLLCLGIVAALGVISVIIFKNSGKIVGRRSPARPDDVSVSREAEAADIGEAVDPLP